MVPPVIKVDILHLVEPMYLSQSVRDMSTYSWRSYLFSILNWNGKLKLLELVLLRVFSSPLNPTLKIGFLKDEVVSCSSRLDEKLV